MPGTTGLGHLYHYIRPVIPATYDLHVKWWSPPFKTSLPFQPAFLLGAEANSTPFDEEPKLTARSKLRGVGGNKAGLKQASGWVDQL